MFCFTLLFAYQANRFVVWSVHTQLCINTHMEMIVTSFKAVEIICMWVECKFCVNICFVQRLALSLAPSSDELKENTWSHTDMWKNKMKKHRHDPFVCIILSNCVWNWVHSKAFYTELLGKKYRKIICLCLSLLSIESPSRSYE